jgi:thermitase
VSSSIASGLALDFLATGDDVFSAKSKGKYGYGTGTSFAAPVAAGIAALVLSANPKLSWQEVRNIMRSTCEKIGGVYYDNGHNDQYGWGRVDAGKAVEAAGPGP